MEKRPSGFNAFFVIFRPLLILAALLTYVLGLGIVHHLAVQINLVTALLGFVMVVLLLETRAFMEAYYRHPNAPENRMANSVKVEDVYMTAVEQFQRPMLLYISIVILGAGALLTMILAIQGALPPSVYVLLGLAFLACFFSAFPPVSLSERGYSEIIESLLVANIIPAIALGMQHGDLHVLLILLTLPLTPLYLGLRITVLLEAYGRDSLRNRLTMLVRMGWQNGMRLHNISVISSYLLIGIFALFRLPWSLTWPPLLSLPFAALQIFQIQQISAGAKPNWRMLTLTAIGTFAITAYSIALTLWIR